ncbi:DUF932 domain-containing protein, partial [Acinetobacter baumannii]
NFADGGTTRLIEGVREAKGLIVARTDEERIDFLTKRADMTKTAAAKVIETVTQEEGSAPESVWDFVQGITAVARRSEHQDARITMERSAGKL